MRRNTIPPALAVFLVVFAVTAAGFAASKIKGGGSGGTTQTMLQRWLRRDANTGVEVFPGILPPALDQILNAGVTNPADRITLPVHPAAKLIGSSYVHQPSGDLVWMMYDVEGDITAVTQAITDQLNKAPWRVVGGEGEETSRIIQFGSAQLAGVQGQAIIELNPTVDTFRATVLRGGNETTLTMRRISLTPAISAAMQPDLTVQRVDLGPAQDAGLKQGDKIVKVNDTPVKNPLELAQAMQAVAASGNPRVGVTYFLAMPLPAAPAAQPFLAPKTPPTLPASFPAAQAWQGLTVVQYRIGTGQDQPGIEYRAAMISKDSPATVAGRVRDGLKAAGWTITGDAPQGFATALQITKASDKLVGQVGIDQSPDDSSYAQVVVVIQSAQTTGTP